MNVCVSFGAQLSRVQPEKRIGVGASPHPPAHPGIIVPRPKVIIAGLTIPFFLGVLVASVTEARVVAAAIHVLAEGIVVIVSHNCWCTRTPGHEIIPVGMPAAILPEADLAT